MKPETTSEHLNAWIWDESAGDEYEELAWFAKECALHPSALRKVRGWYELMWGVSGACLIGGNIRGLRIFTWTTVGKLVDMVYSPSSWVLRRCKLL